MISKLAKAGLMLVLATGSSLSAIAHDSALHHDHPHGASHSVEFTVVAVGLICALLVASVATAKLVRKQ